ncbi:MAG: hypothetical protein IPJ81_16125 [Chitinophagaceae bacterium]|nr:hypothetical protein [Chitinophagaceae bacterium]
MLWVADNDFTKVKELEKLPLLEYYFLLNKKSADVKKALSAKNKSGKNSRRG